jgi:sodium/hydrogen antiporter
VGPVVYGFAMVGGVLVVAALGAGLVDRGPVSFPLLFAALGVALGPKGAGIVRVDLGGPVLGVVATVVLVLVLFLDAVHLETADLRHHWQVPALVVGPGTLLVAAFTAMVAAVLLHLSPLTAAMLGAVLASTDPVLLRDVLRDPRIPPQATHALRVEAGTNDLVILPVLLVLAAVATSGGAVFWPAVLGRIVVVGPLTGFVVGAVGAKAMTALNRRFPVRREYQSLHGIGLVLLAYASGEAVGGDGFLAAFAAGLAVGMANEKLCSCFLEFGAALTESAMLVAFVLFGAALSPLVGSVPVVATLVLAGVLLLIVRPLAVGLVVVGQRRALSGPAAAFLAWFGPRGLTSLLFALLLYDAGAIDQRVFGIVAVVVAVSVVVHGASVTPLTVWYGRRLARRAVSDHLQGEGRA